MLFPTLTVKTKRNNNKKSCDFIQKIRKKTHGKTREKTHGKTREKPVKKYVKKYVKKIRKKRTENP